MKKLLQKLKEKLTRLITSEFRLDEWFYALFQIVGAVWIFATCASLLLIGGGFIFMALKFVFIFLFEIITGRSL